MAEIEDQVRLLADRRFARTAAVPMEQVRPAANVSRGNNRDASTDEEITVIQLRSSSQTGTSRDDSRRNRRL